MSAGNRGDGADNAACMDLERMKTLLITDAADEIRVQSLVGCAGCEFGPALGGSRGCFA